MKKLIVLLLAIAMVGAVSAQVTTSVTLSGSVYLWNKQSAAADAAKISPNGSGYDVLTIAAQGKDGNYGVWLKDTNLFASTTYITGVNFVTSTTTSATQTFLNIDYWGAWYKVGGVKASLGALYGGSFVQYFNNGWLENYDPTDSMYGNGLLVETAAPVSGFNAGVYLPLSGATLVNTVEKASVGFNYAVGKAATVCGQVNLDLVTSATIANVGFDFTGVKGLDAYGWFEYQQAAAIVRGGIGAQYKAATWRAGAEFEGDNNFANWDAIANLRYYVMPTLFVQVRPEYRSTGRIRVRGYVNYAFGNGFAIEPMVGYDKNGATYDGLVSYVRLTYSMSF